MTTQPQTQPQATGLDPAEAQARRPTREERLKADVAGRRILAREAAKRDALARGFPTTVLRFAAFAGRNPEAAETIMRQIEGRVRAGFLNEGTIEIPALSSRAAVAPYVLGKDTTVPSVPPATDS